MTSAQNKRLFGLLIIIGVSLLVLSLMTGQNLVKASQIVKNVREFDLGEKITLYETPQLLSPEEIKAMEKYATVEFFQDDLPSAFQLKADEQNREITGQRDLLAEQKPIPQSDNLPQTPNQTAQQVEESVFKNVETSSLVASTTEARLIESQAQQNIFIRGSIVKVVGKIEMARPAPYFYNVNITCCDMDSFRAMSAVETDGQGNFVVKFATNGKFPLGDWTVTISTIGDDFKIIKHFYNFKLLAPAE